MSVSKVKLLPLTGVTNNRQAHKKYYLISLWISPLLRVCWSLYSLCLNLEASLLLFMKVKNWLSGKSTNSLMFSIMWSLQPLQNFCLQTGKSCPVFVVLRSQCWIHCHWRMLPPSFVFCIPNINDASRQIYAALRCRLSPAALVNVFRDTKIVSFLRSHLEVFFHCCFHRTTLSFMSLRMVSRIISGPFL